MKKPVGLRIDYLAKLAELAAIGESFPRRAATNAERQYFKLKGLAMTHKDRYGIMVITTKGYRALNEVQNLGKFIADNVE